MAVGTGGYCPDCEMALTAGEKTLILKLREACKWEHAQIFIEIAHGKIGKFWRTIKDDPAKYN